MNKHDSPDLVLLVARLTRQIEEVANVRGQILGTFDEEENEIVRGSHRAEATCTWVRIVNL